MMRYDHAVYIGRFEPLHVGHRAVLERALRDADHVIVLVGSAGAPRTTRNPWSFAERQVMIRGTLGADIDRVTIAPLADHLYNETAWIADVQAQVAAAGGDTGRVALIGHLKDASSSYLKAFPQWDLIDAAAVPMLSATEMRGHLFAGDAGALGLLEANVPPQVFAMLDAFRATDAFAALLDEYRHLQTYRAAWDAAPYPPTFVTADAVVVHSGHVLLVTRKAQPGRGLWALPGGFVRQNESVRDAAIRELREETRLRLPVPVLLGSIRGEAVFDHPDRSARGRTITHAFHFDFPAGELPPVRGGDDAARARWVPVAEARRMRDTLFEDHFFILEHFLGAA